MSDETAGDGFAERLGRVRQRVVTLLDQLVDEGNRLDLPQPPAALAATRLRLADRSLPGPGDRRGQARQVHLRQRPDRPRPPADRRGHRHQPGLSRPTRRQRGVSPPLRGRLDAGDHRRRPAALRLPGRRRRRRRAPPRPDHPLDRGRRPRPGSCRANVDPPRHPRPRLPLRRSRPDHPALRPPRRRRHLRPRLRATDRPRGARSSSGNCST